jgi:hypothetical protein
MGLDWLAKIKAHSILSKGMARIPMPSAGGEQDTVALPVLSFLGTSAYILSRQLADYGDKRCVE